MKEYRVAILGATGAVGREMMRVLEERQFPLSELRLLASARSAGSRLPFRGEELVLEQATPQSFAGCDIVLGAAENDVATELLPHAVAQGAVVIDNSSAYRLDPEVPLVVPRSTPRTSPGTRASFPTPTAPPSSPPRRWPPSTVSRPSSK